MSKRILGREQGASSVEKQTRKFRLSQKAGTILCVLLLLCGIVVGFVLGSTVSKRAPARSSSLDSTPTKTVKPGPWGEMEYVPMTIAAPDSILPVRALVAEGTHWLFKGYSRDDLAKFLDTLNLTADQREQLLAPAALHTVEGGVDLSPPASVFFALPPPARLEMYKCLGRFPENDAKLVFIHKASFESRFQDSGVSQETLNRFRLACCDFGEYLVFSGLPTLLDSIPSYDEKTHFLKALTRQNTLLLKLRVKPDSDINALSAYWGKACWSTDVKSMLESLSHVPGGALVDIVEVLPPFPTAMLYTYPVPDNPLTGQVVRRDCLWTAFNFFRDPPDARYSDPAFVMEHLKLDHYPVNGDPRFGDVVLFSKPDGSVVHGAVFLADDFVYTKNGDTAIHPWMLSTITELLHEYSFHVPPEQRLIVSYYRNKYY